MFNNLKGKCLLLFVSAAPLNALAHAGHDHQSQWSSLIHLLWLAPVAIAAYMAISFFKKKQENKL